MPPIRPENDAKPAPVFLLIFIGIKEHNIKKKSFPFLSIYLLSIYVYMLL